MKFSLEDLAAAAELEKRWDVKLGSDTRAYRELLGYTAARILQGAGATPEDLLEYLREIMRCFWTDPAPRGSS